MLPYIPKELKKKKFGSVERILIFGRENQLNSGTTTGLHMSHCCRAMSKGRKKQKQKKNKKKEKKIYPPNFFFSN